MRVIPFLLITALLGCGACTDGDDPAPKPSPEPAPSDQTAPASPTATDVSACPNQDDAIAGAGDRPSLTGDVDGDGADDVVTIALDEAGPRGCTAFLIVATGFRNSSVPIDQEGMSTEVGFPALVRLAEIDGQAGLDVIVNLVAGASTQFAGVFTGGGEPERLRFEQPTEFGDLFPTGSSVGHLEASDCIGPGAIVISEAVPKGAQYQVTRTAYVVVDGKLAPQEEGVTTERLPLDRLDRFPEFRASPFGSCPTE
ncbi:MAG: hypothetical protein ACRDLB_00940 [Actinomycetota bacterium]